MKNLLLVVTLLGFSTLVFADNKTQTKPAETKSTTKPKVSKLEDIDRKELMIIQLTAENERLKGELATCQRPQLQKVVTDEQKRLAEKYGIDWNKDQIQPDGTIIRGDKK